MKRIFLSIALLVTVISSLSSCVATQDRRGSRYHRDRGRHHGPYDSNYRNYDRYNH